MALSSNPHRILVAFVDLHDDPQMTFNGIQNFLQADVLRSDDDWAWAMWLAGEIYPPAQVINESFNFEQLEEATARLTDHRDDKRRLLNINYVQAILDHRGLWESFSGWMCAHHL